MLIHDGLAIPKFEEPIDPSDVELFACVWDAFMDTASISTSTWIFPDGFNLIESHIDITVTDGTSTFNHANTALLATTNLAGSFTITNRVKFTDNRSYDRSFKIKIKEL